MDKKMDKKTGTFIVGGPHSPPPHYDRKPSYDKMKWDRDVMVPMRDGVRLCVDVYRPDAQGKFPALLAFAPHNKDLQTPEACETFRSPACLVSLLDGGTGSRGHEVSRVQGLCACHRKSERRRQIGGRWLCSIGSSWGRNGLYDLIEWIASNPGVTATSG